MIFVSHFWILDEGLNAGIYLLSNLWIEINHQSEESDEVDKSSDCENRNMSELLDQVGNMGDDQFWEDLKDHVRLEGLASGARADETHGLLQQMKSSFLAVDLLGFLLPLSSLHVSDKNLPLHFVDFLLSKVERQPV